jgi:nicotinamide-nucleotide amidase
LTTDRQSVVHAVARLAIEQGLRVVTAESLTSGAIATSLGSGPNAASWFAGAIVAYQEPVKFRLLGVPEGPVVTAACAEQMALGACTLFEADVSVSATGVGGPEPSEGSPPGTVFISVATSDGSTTQALELPGEPEKVLAQTIDHALDLLLHVLTRR